MADISLDVILVALRLNGLLLILIAYSAWQRRPAAGSAEFAILMLTASFWSLTYALGLNVEAFESKVFVNQFTYIAIILIPVFWLFFAARYTGLLSLSTNNQLVLLIMPMISILMVWTNSSHGLFWSNLSPQNEGVISSIATTRHTWFWIHTTYSYICLMIGAYLLLRSLGAGRSQLYMGQGIALALGVFAPWIANALFIFELVPIRLLDPTPFGFTITGVAISWAIYRFKLLDVIPAARDAVLASMTDGVIVLDARNRIIEINPSAEQFLLEGASSKNFIGADATKVLSEWPHVIERFQDVTQAYAMAVPFKLKDRTRYLDVRISPIRDASKRITGRILVTTDVTAQKLATDLKKAKETAESSNLAKSAFLASMSHELRTPLNHIIGYSELLQEEMQANGHHTLYQDDVQKIRSSGKDLLSIITQILELAKLEAKMVKLAPELFSLTDTVSDVITHLQALAEKNGNKVQFKPEAGGWKIQADPARMRTVLYNVIHNAVSFTHQGTVKVSLSEKENRVLVTVQDTGIGIAPEILGTIFEAFNNPHSSTRKKSEGLGLGLATAHELVRLMNGSIKVESEPNKGSIFTIDLPMGNNS